MSVNKVIFIGHCGTEPVLRYTRKEIPVVNLRFVTQEPGEEEAQWHNLTFFGGKAELVAKFATVGKFMYVEGKLQPGKFTGSDGREHSTYEILVKDFRFLGHSPLEK